MLLLSVSSSQIDECVSDRVPSSNLGFLMALLSLFQALTILKSVSFRYLFSFLLFYALLNTIYGLLDCLRFSFELFYFLFLKIR